jgi:hypothetical protein
MSKKLIDDSDGEHAINVDNIEMVSLIQQLQDKFTISITFKTGSTLTLNYLNEARAKRVFAQLHQHIH